MGGVFVLACACRLHVRGQRWVPITDCGIPHAPDDPACTSGMAQGVFIKDVTGQPYLGQVRIMTGTSCKHASMHGSICAHNGMGHFIPFTGEGRVRAC